MKSRFSYSLKKLDCKHPSYNHFSAKEVLISGFGEIYLSKLYICIDVYINLSLFIFICQIVHMGVHIYPCIYTLIGLPWLENPASTSMWHTEHWTAVLTLLGLISSAYRDLHHWRSNQQPQTAELKLCHWATGPYRAEAKPN